MSAINVYSSFEIESLERLLLSEEDAFPYEKSFDYL
jgi:hypothetical protein